MKDRRRWRWVVPAALLTLGVAASKSSAFVENTETDGEVRTNLNGVWLVVTHIEFPRPTATPEPGASPAPTPQQSPAARAAIRNFNVVNLLRIVHTPKAQADVLRAEAKKKEEAAIEKAKQILAEEAKKSLPIQTESGEVEGEAKVLVPVPPIKEQQATPGDDIDVYLLDVAFPKNIQDSIDKAQKAEVPWTPTDKDLALLKSSWSTLPPSGRDEYSKIDWKVTASDKYDDNLKADPTTKDAKFALTGNQEMVPKPNVPKTNVIVYGVEQANGDVLSGKHTRAMMASAPFPLPIEMKGSFKMYRVAPLPQAPTGKPAAAEAKPAAGSKKKSTSKQ